LEQSFSTTLYKTDLSLYEKDDLTSFRDDYFPIVIGIQTVFPKGYQGKSTRSIEYTYGTFFTSEDCFKYKALKQKLLYNKTIFDLQDIYGVE